MSLTPPYSWGTLRQVPGRDQVSRLDVLSDTTTDFILWKFVSCCCLREIIGTIHFILNYESVILGNILTQISSLLARKKLIHIRTDFLLLII